MGVLMGHYCDGPILLGYEISTTGYDTAIRAGVPFTKYTLSSALQLFAASNTLQQAAEEANAYVVANAWTSPVPTSEQYLVVVRASVGRTSLGSATVNLTGFTPEFDGFLQLAGLGTNASLAQTKAFLRGTAVVTDTTHMDMDMAF